MISCAKHTILRYDFCSDAQPTGVTNAVCTEIEAVIANRTEIEGVIANQSADWCGNPPVIPRATGGAQRLPLLIKGSWQKTLIFD